MQCLVLDTGALLRGYDMKCKAERIITCKEVLLEVRNKKSREHLENLPYELEVLQPDAQSILAVLTASRKVGDYGFLSKTDIKVLALAHQFTKKHDPDYANEDPLTSAEETADAEEAEELLAAPTAIPVSTATIKPGVSFADALRAKAALPRHPPATVRISAADTPEQDRAAAVDENASEVHSPHSQPRSPVLIPAETRSNESPEHELGFEPLEEGEEAEEGEEEEGEEVESTDDEGWITPFNIHKQRATNQEEELGPVQRPVGLTTLDFPMQNTALHMGMQLVCMDGRAIHYLRKHILRCHGCYELVTDTSRLFCPACGSGDTLKKVSYTVESTGEVKLWLNPKHRIRVKGTIHGLPKPKGGKYGTNRTCVLREDQLKNCGRYNRKNDAKMASVWEEDYTFAPKIVRKNITHHQKTTSFYAAMRRRR
eukprot:NODE_1509_length_1477_cov_51.405185_g1431_i0.p1 GENE.NODE_1509_length_1477_cov_51.405185_g1431_i0~~NODE_1509_length_1477_cov_51.405185_g1431_i0.p1  ORF type:complete len:443 (+),score=151.18 NODE_1509_length_1477_cov_51.405185_g1431_i0:46-1329(+)